MTAATKAVKTAFAIFMSIMVSVRNVDKGNMDFDQLGKQHVSRRRKPSPLSNTRKSPVSFDAGLPQHVWPRPGRMGTRFSVRKAGESFFGASTRRRPAGSRTSDGRTANGRPVIGGNTRLPKRRRPVYRSSGFQAIPSSWLKKLAAASVLVVMGIIVINWQSISETLEKPDIAAASLVNQPFEEARFDPLTLWDRQDTAFEEIPLNLTESFSWVDETIQSGDSISKIAARFSLAQGSIIALNKLENAWDIKIGSTLKIPNMDGIPYIVQKNDSISRIAEKMKVPQNAILDANDLLSDTILPGDTLFIPGAKMDAGELSRAVNRNAVIKPMIFPVGGRITSSYGWREDPVRPVSGEKRFHKAVDLAGKIGDPVKAAMQGSVLYISNNPNLGNFMVLKHGEYQTLYAHLSAYSVKVGETVRQGQEIGKVGNTGYTTGPHLHFEVYHKGNRVNPLELIK